MRNFAWFFSSGGHRGAVREEDIREAVAVVIERDHAAGHGLDDLLLGRRAVFEYEVDARSRGNVAKADRRHLRGRRRFERAGKQDRGRPSQSHGFFRSSFSVRTTPAP